jgi:arylsulfatase A-like enzyme
MVVRFIKSHQKLENTFLYIHYLDPHDPYAPVERCETFFRGFTPARKPVRDGIAFTLSGEEAIREKLRTGLLPTPVPLTKEELDYLIALYDCEIKSVDDGIGRILEALREAGAMDHTTIVITSDHGEEFLEHGMLRHGYQLFEETVKVPLIIYRPGHTAKRSTIDDPVEAIDLFPTLLSFLDIPYKGRIDGRILPPFDPAYAAQKSAVLGMTRFRKQDKAFLLQGPLKIIKDFNSGELLFFDLSENPMEETGQTVISPAQFEGMPARLEEMIEQSTRIMASPVFEAPENETLKQRLRALGYLD